MVIASITTITFPVKAKTETKRQVVIFEDDVDSAKKDNILEKHKALKIKEIKGTNAIVVMASSDSKLSEDEEIRFVEDDYVISIEGNTNKKDKKSDEELPEETAETIPWGVEYMNDLSPDSVDDDIKVTGSMELGFYMYDSYGRYVGWATVDTQDVTLEVDLANYK